MMMPTDPKLMAPAALHLRPLSATERDAEALLKRRRDVAITRGIAWLKDALARKAAPRVTRG